MILPQRFRPLEPNNHTTRSIASLFQDPLNKLNNLTKEVKANVVPALGGIKDKVLDVFGLNTNVSTSTILNQQAEQHQQQGQAGQNVPAPPLADHAQRQQQPDHVESAQAAPQPVQDRK